MNYDNHIARRLGAMFSMIIYNNIIYGKVGSKCISIKKKVTEN